jgi:CRP-like cAMP-binding protein
LGVLATRGWLAEQPPAFNARIAALGRWRRVTRGQPVFFAGDPPDGLYGLGEGALTVTFPLVGDEPVTLYRAELGFWIGDSALLAGAVRMVSLHAASDARLFHAPGEAIRALLAREPQWWPCLYALSHRNVTLTLTVLAEALSLTARARLSRTLLRMAGDGDAVVVTQGELAALIGMTRSSLQRALTSLAEAGAVRQEFGRIAIIDAAALRALTNEA